MLRHLPGKYLKKLRKHFLFSEKEVIYTAGVDRRPNNDDSDDKRTDDNLDDRTAKFSNQIKANSHIGSLFVIFLISER